MTYIIRLVRAEMMEILQTDYIKFARARGISENSIKYKHALKNGLIPVITIAGINIGTLIAFSIITETVFQWPGMGFLFIQAVKFEDIPIMSAYLVFIAFVFVMIKQPIKHFLLLKIDGEHARIGLLSTRPHKIPNSK